MLISCLVSSVAEGTSTQAHKLLFTT